MIHITIPTKTATGSTIPLVKYGQGREPIQETSTETAAQAIGRGCKPVFLGAPTETAGLDIAQNPTFAAKLRAAGHQGPVLPKTVREEMEQRRIDGLAEQAPVPVADLPLVSQRGFKAGVFATCLGGAFLGALFFGCGALICGCVASGCVGFVAGMLMTEDWK
jgi:predicted phage tail protein